MKSNQLNLIKHSIIKFTPSQWLIFAMVLWQAMSVYLLAINVLPVWTPWVNFGVLGLLMLALPKSKALQLFILSIPFFIVLPNHYTDTLNMWRPLLVILFLRSLFTFIPKFSSVIQSSVGIQKINRNNGSSKNNNTGNHGMDPGQPPPSLKLWRAGALEDSLVASGMTRKIAQRITQWIKQLHTYEILAVIFFAWCTVTLLWAKYPSQGIKQLIFILNAVMIYPVVALSLREGAKPWSWRRSNPKKQTGMPHLHPPAGGLARNDNVIKNDQILTNLQLTTYNLQLTLAISTGIIIFIGYGQFIASLIFDFYHFWQSWAVNIANLYYGNDFANVSSYSNSWLSGNLAGLRMFSIMPSSHAFAMVCVIFIGVLSVPRSYTVTNTSDQLNQKSKVKSQNGNLKIIKFKDFLSDFFKFDIWTLVFAALGIILSGTRGVWVGMIPVLAVALVLYYKFQHKTQLKTFLASMLLVVIFFSALPIINSSIGNIRNGIQGNLEDRASSILDLSESSNAGRLQIWKESLVFAIKHPFGVGFGNFITTLNAENKPLDNFTNERNNRYNLPQKYITAHNLYLQILVETSAVGLILFILIWVAFFKDIILSFRIPAWRWNKRDPESLLKNNNDKFPLFQQESKDPVLQRDDRGETTSSQAYNLPTYYLQLSLVLLWCLSYSAFDLTWLNDKMLLYTFVIIALISDE